MKATGILQYDPKATTVQSLPWSLILKCDVDWYRKTVLDVRGQMPQKWGKIVDQLRSTGSSGVITEARLGLMGDMMLPPWGCHISLLRQERPRRNISQWGFLNGKTFTFEFDPEPWYNHRHVWFDIFSQDLLDIREFFGLPRYPRCPLHLSVGNWDEHILPIKGKRRFGMKELHSFE